MEVIMGASPETRLFRSHWQDGTLDLVAGGAIALIGVGYFFEQFLVPVVVVPLGLAAWFILRRRVVEPRAGYVEFSRRRRERSTRESLGTVAVGIGFLVLVVLLTLRVGGTLTVPPAGGGPGTGGHLVDAGPALLLAVASIVAAGLTRSPRFAVYAAVLVGSGALAVFAGAGPALPVLIGGLVIGGTGSALLIRFLAESRQARDGG